MPGYVEDSVRRNNDPEARALDILAAEFYYKHNAHYDKGSRTYKDTTEVSLAAARDLEQYQAANPELSNQQLLDKFDAGLHQSASTQTQAPALEQGKTAKVQTEQHRNRVVTHPEDRVAQEQYRVSRNEMRALSSLEYQIRDGGNEEKTIHLADWPSARVQQFADRAAQIGYEVHPSAGNSAQLQVETPTSSGKSERQLRIESMSVAERQLISDITVAQDRMKEQYIKLQPVDRSRGWSNEEHKQLMDLRYGVSQLGELRSGIQVNPAKTLAMEYGQDAPGVKQFVDRAKHLGYKVETTTPSQQADINRIAEAAARQRSLDQPDPTAVLEDRAHVLAQVAAHPLGTADIEAVKGAATSLAMDARAAANALSAETSPASASVLDGVADEAEDADFELEMKREELARTAELIGANHSRSFQAATAKLANGIRSGVSEIDLSQNYEVPEGMSPAEAQRLIAQTHRAVTAALAPLAAQSKQDLNIDVIAGTARLAPRVEIQQQVKSSRGYSL